MADKADKLQDYRHKRDFQSTSEPTGVVEAAPAKEQPGQLRRFVVQQHDATRMHYDFRLEVDGVLKSWAVPEGPSTDPQVKRLAVETEDHPMEYLTFEGVIPKGQYGAGPVIVWDTGTYVNIRGQKRKPFTMQEAYDQGLIEVRLEGEKLRGAYALIHTKFKDAKNSWLLVKMKDGEADPELDITGEYPQSVKTGKTLAEVLEADVRQTLPEPLRVLSPDARAKLKETSYPGWMEPMLASPAKKPFSNPNWIYEQKLDGQRCLIYRKGDQVQLISRNQLLITDQYPELVAALSEQGRGDFVADGEIVALDERGRPSFERLQQRMHVKQPGKQLLADVPATLFLFDVMYLDGYLTTGLNQLERKEVLKDLLPYVDPLRYMEHQQGDGAKLFKAACQQGLEGLIAKEASTSYQNRRSKSWLKFKCVNQQEAVVGGYTDGTAGMRGFGSLLVGVYSPGDDRLQFAGGVGTGFSDEAIRDIGQQLEQLTSDENPFAPDDMLPKTGVHWVRPQLVAQVGYGEWTSANKMRHPRFLGLRTDIGPQQVTREQPVEAEPDWEPEALPARGTSATETTRTVDGHKIKLTNLDKQLFPDGITKGQIIDYYERIALVLLPHFQDRPLNLERFPSGIGEKGFYHKETPDYFPAYIDRVEVNVSDTETQEQSMANNAATLVYLAQMAAITLHPWLSRAQHLTRPDKIVFDLDPSTDDSWEAVVSGAQDLRDMLGQMGLPSFVMATGSRGLHVAVPLQPDYEYEAITLFSKAVCRKLERMDHKFTTQFRKDKRKGRVFLDHLRNRYGHTSVGPYSVRAKPGAPVAAPLCWEELEQADLRSNSFTILNLFERLEKIKGDPWKDFFKYKAPLPDFETIEKVLTN